jgi:hypothetical protein
LSTVFIRRCIFKFGSENGEVLSEEVEIGESYFGGRRKDERGERSKGKIR